MMETWSERPRDLASLLNPAFTGILLRSAVDGYVREAGVGLPYPLAFLVLPLSVHRQTAERLPRGISTMFQSWLQENREVLVGFPDRAKSLLPFTREAIIFAGQRGALSITDDGSLVPGEKKLKGISPYKTKSHDEVKEAVRKSEFVGRWFALAGPPPTVYSLLGVRP